MLYDSLGFRGVICGVFQFDVLREPSSRDRPTDSSSFGTLGRFASKKFITLERVDESAEAKEHQVTGPSFVTSQPDRQDAFTTFPISCHQPSLKKHRRYPRYPRHSGNQIAQSTAQEREKSEEEDTPRPRAQHPRRSEEGAQDFAPAANDQPVLLKLEADQTHRAKTGP